MRLYSFSISCATSDSLSMRCRVLDFCGIFINLLSATPTTLCIRHADSTSCSENSRMVLDGRKPRAHRAIGNKDSMYLMSASALIVVPAVPVVKALWFERGTVAVPTRERLHALPPLFPLEELA